MSAEDFEVLRQHMLAEISAGTFHVSGLIGKAALDERVMTAMGSNRTPALRLRQHSTSDRLRQDDLAAIYCRADDRFT
jgi:hypothetical protein